MLEATSPSRNRILATSLIVVALAVAAGFTGSLAGKLFRPTGEQKVSGGGAGRLGSRG
jgi:hypothetical protein